MVTSPKEFLHAVRNQYENLPYPYRDPETELNQLFGNEAHSLSAFTHMGWEGKRDLRKGSRLLIAGQGTGDVTVFFAEQLRGCDAEIVGLDMSLASIEVCKARLAKRGLDNVRFVHASLLDLPSLGLGEFDIIDCSGVLHHLADPVAGLKALAGVLKSDGIMNIMVYGYYGRIAIYMVQDMMRSLVTPDMDMHAQVALCKEFLQAIPQGHWLTYNNENFKVDIREPSGAGIYDLLLHPQDRAYTVPQLYDWLDEAGVKLHGFFGTQVGEEMYDPKAYTHSEILRARLSALPLREQHRIAELMHGHMIKHCFYAVKETKIPAQLADDMVMSFGSEHRHEPGFVKRVGDLIAQNDMGNVYEETYTVAGAPPLRITKHALTHEILRRIDGKTSIRGVYEALIADGVIAAAGSENYQAYWHDMAALYHELHSRQKAYLLHESIAAYPTVPQIMARYTAQQSAA